MNNDQVKYYSRRAHEYEKIYDKPERQHDLKFLSDYLKENFRNMNVLEIACGTGYWTQLISETAASIISGDINTSVLKIAQSKQYKCPVEFIAEDVYSLSYYGRLFDAGFGGFIWSHIPKDDLSLFLKTYLSNFKRGAAVVFIDNNYAEGCSTPIAFKDDSGNTYQIRKLEDGSEHSVIKNYPADEELIKLFKPHSCQIEIERLRHFWLLKVILE